MKRDGTHVQNIENAEICKVKRQRMKDDMNNYHEQQQLKALGGEPRPEISQKEAVPWQKKHNIITLKEEDGTMIKDLSRLFKNFEFSLKLYSAKRPQNQPLSITDAPPPPPPPPSHSPIGSEGAHLEIKEGKV